MLSALESECDAGNGPRNDDAPAESTADAHVWRYASANLPWSATQHRHAHGKPGPAAAANWHSDAGSTSPSLPGRAAAAALRDLGITVGLVNFAATSIASTGVKSVNTEARTGRRSQPFHNGPARPESAVKRHSTKRQTITRATAILIKNAKQNDF